MREKGLRGKTKHRQTTEEYSTEIQISHMVSDSA